MDLDCRKCSEKQKIEHGYYEDSPVPGKWQIGEWKFQRCPLTLIRKQSVDYLNAYALFQKGILPNGESWLDETEKFLEAMQIIANEKEKAKQNG